MDPDCCDYYGDQALMLAIERDSSDDCKTVKLCLNTGQSSISITAFIIFNTAFKTMQSLKDIKGTC